MLNGSARLDTKKKIIAFVIAAAEWIWKHDVCRLTLWISDLPQLNYHV